MSVKKQCLRLKDLFVNRICFLAEPGKPVIKIQITQRYCWFRHQLRLAPRSRAGVVDRATGTLRDLEFARVAYSPELVASIGIDEWPAFAVRDLFTEYRVLVTVVGCEVDVDLHRVLSLCSDDVNGGETVTRVFSKYKAAKRWSEVRAGVMPVERSFFIRNQLCRGAATEV